MNVKNELPQLQGAGDEASSENWPERVPEGEGVQQTGPREDGVRTATPKPSRRNAVRIFDPEELEVFAADLPLHHSAFEDRKRAKTIIEKLAKLGPWRNPLRLSNAARSKLASLSECFPNFASVVDFLEASFLLQPRRTMLPPILLDGPPGVGKTLFATELAGALGVPMRRIDMAATQAAFALVGSDKAWANSQTGAVFEMLAFGKSASPVLLLDEVDKSTGDDRYPVVGALYGLLERGTAREFRDASIPQVALDSRHIVWLATSNDASRIPEPIRDRMRIFAIEAPKVEAMRGVVRRIAATTWRECGRRGRPPALGDAVLERLATLPARKAKLAIAEAFGRAILHGREELALDDLPALAPRRRRMGF